MLRALILPFGLAILLLYSLAVFFGMAGGRSWNFGYYGEYNRVKHALASVPRVKITKEWANEDTALEEFGFDLTASTAQTVSLTFQQADPIRRLSGESLTRALSEKIQSQLFASPAHQ